MKVFAGTVVQSQAISDVIVPADEQHLLTHRAEAVVVAPSKAAAVVMMEALGVDPKPIRSVGGTGLRQERDGYNRHVERLIDAGLVDPERQGCVFYLAAVKGRAIATAEPGGDVHEVGAWTYTSATGLSAQPTRAGSSWCREP